MGRAGAAAGGERLSTRLAQATLHRLALPVPDYDRARVRVGIVHLGVGGFHRAHMGAYVDRLLSAGHLDWGICGVGTQPADRRMRDALRSQDLLYSLVLKHPDGHLDARVLGPLVDYLYAPHEPDAVIERLADPATRVVSLTITEGGYLVDPTTRRFSVSEPAALLDLQPGAVPSTALGLLTEGLRLRRKRGLAPFAVVSCDNLPHNGLVARTAVCGFADRRDPELGAWVRERVSFPSSMVDRITPVTTDADRRLLAERFGVDDAWPVVAEPYTQWVLEDVPGDGPPWEQVGVQLVVDVAPYETVKLRLLNAGHQAIGYLGYLAGYRTTDEVCADPAFSRFLLDYMELEAGPTLPPVPGIDLDHYRRQLLQRFANPHVRDTLTRLCAEASDRIPTFLLPVVREQLARGGDVRRSALVIAAWAQYAGGVDEQGRPIDVVDRLLEAVRSAAADPDPEAFLRRTGLFGELAADTELTAAFRHQRDLLRTHGARRAVALLAETETEEDRRLPRDLTG